MKRPARKSDTTNEKVEFDHRVLETLGFRLFFIVVRTDCLNPSTHLESESSRSVISTSCRFLNSCRFSPDICSSISEPKQNKETLCPICSENGYGAFVLIETDKMGTEPNGNLLCLCSMNTSLQASIGSVDILLRADFFFTKIIESTVKK